MAQTDGGRGFDRSYKRGAVMGLTVAEAFILLSFCLLLLFTWWQIDTEKRSLIAADAIADMTPDEKAAIIAGLSDGTFALAAELRKAGVDANDPKVAQDLRDYARFMREEDFQRLVEATVKLDPETRLSLADAVEVTDEVALRAALAAVKGGDTTAERVAGRLAANADAQNKMVDRLNAALGDQIRAAGGSIDGMGTITLPQQVLFDVGQDRIRDTSFLRDFCGSWVGALRASGLDLSDLKIEGHASSEGRPGQDANGAYLYNLDLSQRRAKSALNACLGGVSDPQARDWASARLAAIGYSSARLIMNPDGSENHEASRRVMFSVNVNQQGLIDDIGQDVGETAVVMEAEGPARVIDGDTIEIKGTRYRISGIDAPERGQPCINAAGQSFDCGEVARRGLEQAIGGQEVSCKADTVDLYRRPVATCTVSGIDIGKAMVVQGLAVPFEEYSKAYVPEGAAAEVAHAGLWNTSFDMPWDYRKAK